ncbi:MAG: AFG1/ZapE family ATPase [Thiolinea sp.]
MLTVGLLVTINQLPLEKTVRPYELLENYHKEIRECTYSPRSVQERAVQLLQAAADRLQEQLCLNQCRKRGVVVFSACWGAKRSCSRSLNRMGFICGAKGRARQDLADGFVFASVPLQEKKRYHFHHFMELLHKAIKQHLTRKTRSN